MRNNGLKKVIFSMLVFLSALFLFHSANASAQVVKRVGIAKGKHTVIYKKALKSSKKKYILKRSDTCYIRKIVTKRHQTWYFVSYLTPAHKRVRGYVPKNKIKQTSGISEQNLNYTGTTKEKLNLKKVATSSAPSIFKIFPNKDIIITGYLTTGNTKWYKCKIGKKVGYLKRNDITTKKDIVFEEKIKAFPSSYKPSLRRLHQTYPKWEFKEIRTNLDWNDVQKNESKPGLNVIQSNLPKNGLWGAPFSYLSTSSSCYNPKTDAYTVFDGTNWYAAAPAVIAYYMDPRNALNPEQIWQFKSFKYEGGEKKTVIKNMLKDTFMSGNYTYWKPDKKKKITRSYASSFLTAGKRANISAYFLANRARNELGLKGSPSVSGKYPGYEGYYNYYNVGANDSREGLAIRNGLQFAKKADSKYLKPWNTPYKSILGGAVYIASGYLPVGQNTSYFYKFNVVNKAQLYRHQYMSNVQCPSSESLATYKTYKELNILANKYVFYIPTYKNMPETPCKLPSLKGNSNNYLKTLKIESNQTILPFDSEFEYSKTDYKITVPYTGMNGQEIELFFCISASKISKFSTIVSGTGEQYITLAPNQTHTFNIVCRSQSGTERTYKIEVTCIE